MKKLLLWCLVPLAWACSSSPTTKAVPAVDPTHAAVTAYLKKTLDDPASYQPARWGKEKPYTKRDVAIEQSGDLILEARHQGELGQVAADGYMRTSEIYGETNPTRALGELAKAKRANARYAHRADSVMALSKKLRTSTDTTRLGMGCVHAYRAKNKMGALVLDSAYFTVMKTGEVQVQPLQ